MTKANRALKILLEVLGVSGLFAVVAVIMPMSWMFSTHHWLGLGKMPAGPVVEYLARSVSAFYVLFSAICLALAADLERYRPLVQLVGVIVALMGVVFVGVDVAAGMPWWWSVSEGPPEVVVGTLMFVLARHGG
jgi:hypothetical protein